MAADAARPAPLPATPRISVVIPARNAARTLPQAVRSVLDQRCPGPVEVIVAVADPETGRVAGELAATHAEVRVVPNPRGTTPAGLNAAIAAATGDVIVRLDAHARLPAGYLERAVELLRTTGAANVGGRQLPVAEGGFARAVAYAMTSPLGSGGARYRVGGPAGDVDTVYLGVFRRDALLAVGGFDERLLRNQDYELNWRLRQAGWRVYFHPDLVVTYRPRASLRALWRQYHDYGTWKRRMLRLHPEALQPRQVGPPALVVGLLAGTGAAAVGVWQPLAGLAGAYAGAVLLGAAAASRSWRWTPPTALALVTMHLAWGVGFLFGRARDAEGS